MRRARPFQALETAFAAEACLRPGETALAAVSGGPDSAALAALLATAAAASGAAVLFGHVDHAVRASAAQDEAVALALGALLGVRVATVRLPPGPASEERLRDARYGALAALARRSGATRVFTGHQAEDQTETVLLALFRGAGPEGLCGMPQRRELAPGISLERPLLRVEPALLRAYCAHRRLPYALDPTNADQRYRRNALRAALAALRPDFPHLDASVARCAVLLRDERAGTPRADLRRRVREALRLQAGDTRDVTFERLDAAARAVEREAPGRHFLRRGVELIVE